MKRVEGRIGPKLPGRILSFADVGKKRLLTCYRPYGTWVAVSQNAASWDLSGLYFRAVLLACFARITGVADSDSCLRIERPDGGIMLKGK